MSSSPPDPAPIDLAHAADFRIGRMAVSPSTREISGPGGSEILEPRVMQVLVALARRRGQIVSRDDLIRDCWGGRIVGEDALNRCIGRVRRLADADGGFDLETVPRVGYRILETAPDMADAPLPAAAQTAVPWRLDLLLPIALAVGVLLLGIGLAIWLLRPAPVPPPAATAMTVAVLPFDPLGSQEDLRVFGDAVAEQILDVMSDNQVRSISRAASADLRGAGRDTAAARLGVGFIVDGTVTHGDAGLHVTVHLDHVPTHATLWTGTFDQAGADPTTLQIQVAAKIVDIIGAALQAVRANSPHMDDETLALFIKAMDHSRMNPAREHIAQSLDLFRAVVAKAPDFSFAHSELGGALISLAYDAPADEALALLAQAREQTAQALSLNPHNGDAYLNEALLVPGRDWGRQDALLRKAIAVEPSRGSLYNYLAGLLQNEGRVAEALPLMQRARMLDPLSPYKAASAALSLAGAGHCTDAVTAIERAGKLWPAHPLVWGYRVPILGHCDRRDEARALLATTPPVSMGLEPGYFDAWHAYLDALDRSTPDTNMRAAKAILAARASGAFYVTSAVEMLARLGDVDAAFAQADLALPTDAPSYKAVATAFLFRQNTASMRRDKRFMPLMRRVGLAAYWVKSGNWPDFCAEPGLPYDCRSAAPAH